MGLDRQASSHRPDPVAHVGDAGALAAVTLRQPGAVVAHLEVNRLRLGLPELHHDGTRALCVLRGVLQGLATAEVDGTLDLGCVPAHALSGQRGRERTRCRRLRERLDETAFEQEARVEAAGQRPDVRHCLVHVPHQLVKPLCALRGVARDFLSRELELDRERQQPLLRAVVQIPLDTPPFLVGRRHDAAARRLAALSAKSAAQSRDAGSAAPSERSPLPPRSSPAPPPARHRGSSAAIGTPPLRISVVARLSRGLRKLDRMPHVVHPLGRIAGRPVDDLERWIVDRLGDHLLQLAARSVDREPRSACRAPSPRGHANAMSPIKNPTDTAGVAKSAIQPSTSVSCEPDRLPARSGTRRSQPFAPRLRRVPARAPRA